MDYGAGAPARWMALAAALIAQTTVSLVAQGTPIVAPFVQTEFDLSRAQIGLLSSAVTLGAGCMLGLAGLAVDRYGERAVMIVGSLLTGLSGLAVSAAPDYGWVLGGLAGVGLGAACVTPAGSKVVVRWFAKTQRALAMGIRQTGVPLGGALAALLLPLVVIRHGWRAGIGTAALGALVGGALFLAVALWLEGRSSPAPALWKGGGGTRGGLPRALWLLGLAGALLPFGQFCLAAYLPLFLKEVRGLPLPQGAALLAAAALAGAAGRVLLGLASDRLFRGRRAPVVAIAGLVSGLLTLMLGHSAAVLPLWAVAAAVAMVGFFSYGWNGVWMTLASESAPPGQEGRTLGIALTMMQVGVVVAPPAFGWLVDRGNQWPVAWSALAGVLFLGAGLMLRVDRRRAEHAPASDTG